MVKYLNNLVKNIVQKSLFLYVQQEGSHVQIQVPLRQPVYSLPQAAYHASLSPIPAIDTALWSFESFMPMSMDNINDPFMPMPMDNINYPFMPMSMDNMIWGYYSLLPHHVKYLMAPYNRTAMVVDGTEILTFDGAVLRAPHSSCKVLLASYKSDSLTMENKQASSLPQFTLKASGVTVVVKPDFTVTVNGQPVSGPQETQGKVQVYKTSEKITIMTPFITLRVYQKSNSASIEVSGWTFGQLAGLLGTYDGEMGNDWLTPAGSKASSLQELVRSWQEDQQCQTPSISPVSPLHTPVVRMMQCYTLMGVRSRCNPVVRPDPFLKMCFASKNACHVAKAYSAICSTKGVKDVFPLGC